MSERGDYQRAQQRIRHVGRINEQRDSQAENQAGLESEQQHQHIENSRAGPDRHVGARDAPAARTWASPKWEDPGTTNARIPRRCRLKHPHGNRQRARQAKRVPDRISQRFKQGMSRAAQTGQQDPARFAQLNHRHVAQQHVRRTPARPAGKCRTHGIERSSSTGQRQRAPRSCTQRTIATRRVLKPALSQPVMQMFHVRRHDPAALSRSRPVRWPMTKRRTDLRQMASSAS